MCAILPDIPVRLLAQPLDYLQADHCRHRTVLNLMMQIAEGTAAEKAAASAALDYLETGLPLHYADEETLFPLLRQRCLPEDGIEAVLGRLRAEHIEGDASAKLLARALRASLAAGSPMLEQAELFSQLRSFVKLERLHLALENAVLIPLARVRLTPEDLASLSHSMRARRTSTHGAAAAVQEFIGE
jgi:iron-sulfur cluster repair protein YtfE (RIC family)